MLPCSEFEGEFDEVGDGVCHGELEERVAVCECEIRLRLAVGGRAAHLNSLAGFTVKQVYLLSSRRGHILHTYVQPGSQSWWLL